MQLTFNFYKRVSSVYFYGLTPFILMRLRLSVADERLNLFTINDKRTFFRILGLFFEEYHEFERRYFAF